MKDVINVVKINEEGLQKIRYKNNGKIKKQGKIFTNYFEIAIPLL